MNQDLQHELDDLKQEIQELKEIIKPMAETYAAAVRIGKWTSALVVFISIMLGISLALKELLKK
jgi:hypothetical protein